MFVIEAKPDATHTFCLASNLRDHSVDRLIQGMKTIVAWQASSCYIFSEARRLHKKGIIWKLSEFHYDDDAVQHEPLDTATVTYVLEHYRGEAPDPNVVKMVLNRTRTAKVHAEASLMHWIATVKASLLLNLSHICIHVFLQDASSTQDWPIGVSKKCCYVCWLLHLQYNRIRTHKFILPGTHGVFYAWLPPPGLPNVMLVFIRNELIAACKQAVPCHSRNSSVDSGISDLNADDDEAEGEELDTAMPSMPRIDAAGSPVL